MIQNHFWWCIYNYGYNTAMADHSLHNAHPSKKYDKTNSFDSYPYPAGFIFLMHQVGLLTYPVCCAFPAFASGKDCNKPNSTDGSRDTQQQVLFRIHTGFPFHPSAGKCSLVAPCALQMYVLFLELQNFF